MPDKSKVRDGKPCVDDCVAKEAILNLRKNPEIEALMAVFAGENKMGAIDWDTPPDDPMDLLRLSPVTPHRLSAEAILLLAQTRRREEDPLYNS